jgi:hypothetical protein
MIKNSILSNNYLREFYFFISGKKLNRKKIDRKIETLSNKNKQIVKSMIPGLIVSLTTYGSRIYDVKYVLYSLIVQSVLPEKVIVWLSNTEYNSLEKIPSELDIFKLFNVEFILCDDLKSYKKLIPALELYPEKIIVTADDDVFYKKQWLEKLWKQHIREPNTIAAHCAHKILFDNNKKIKSYILWKNNISAHCPSLYYLPTGCGGILYQKRLLHKDICNAALFTKLAPAADDIWFYFMAFLNKTKISVVTGPYNKLKYVDIYKEYGLNNKPALSLQNIANGHNDRQLHNILNHYNIDEDTFYHLLYN